MRSLFSILLLTIIGLSGSAQIVNLQWEKSYGGSFSDEAYSIQQATDGGYIVTGASNSVDGDVTGYHGGLDYWVLKLNDTGGIQWKTCLGGSQDDVSFCIQQTADGGYIVAGQSESDSGAGDIPPQPISIVDSEVTGFRGLEYDYWIVKLSSTGGIQWTKCYGGDDTNSYPSFARSIRQTTDLGYIIAGETYSDSPEVYHNHGAPGTPDYWVVKTDDTGAIKWAKCYGGSGYEDAKNIRQTADGGYIIVGESSSNDSQVTGNHGGTDYWVVKTDDTGAIQWEKSLGGSGTDIGYDVIQAYDGGYLVVGGSNSSDSQVTGNHGNDDYWVVKLSSSGAIEWENSYGGSNNDWAVAVTQMPDSGYVVAGYSNSVDGNVTGNHGNNDYWVIKLSKHGVLVWQKSLGGSSDDYANAVYQTTDTGVIVAGGSLSNDSEVTGNHGGEDYWIVKLSSCMLSSVPVITPGTIPLTTATYYTKYQWMMNGAPITGATNASYSPAGLGIYSVFVIDSNGCAGTSLGDTLKESVPNILNNPFITISPNPTNGLVYINGAGVSNIKVYDMQGALIKEETANDVISLSDMPAGGYIIKLFNNSGAVLLTDKIVKQ